MKYIARIAILCLGASFGSATDFGIRILLNKGQTLPTGETCNGTEWSSILSTIDTTINSRRLSLRKLPVYPAWCEQKCVGFADGTCIGRHPSCNGYRQLHEQEDSSMATIPKPYSFYRSLRDLFVSTTCQGQITELNNALNNLKPSLSTQCQTVLDSQREFTCLTTIEGCDIQRIRLMNADNDTVLVDDFTSGMSIRRSASRTVTFEAINDSCVCNVQFIIKNSAGQIIHSRFEFYRPFVAFSNSVPNALGVVDLYGARFSIGSYTLEYYPDNDTSKTQRIAFTVIA
jgi:hypothetical protein